MAEKIKMVQLRHIHSGALVEVLAEKVARLGGEWEPADKPAATTAKKAPAKKTAARKG